MNNSFVWVKSFCLALRLIKSDTLGNFLLGGDRSRKRKEDGTWMRMRFRAVLLDHSAKAPTYGSHDFVTSSDLTLQIVANLKWPT